MMQNGQPKKLNPIYEEKLSNMEKSYEVIQGRINKYDAALQRLDKLEAQHWDLSDRLNAHINAFVQFQENNEKNFWGTEKILKSHDKTLDDLKSQVANVPTNIKRVQDSHDNDISMFGRSLQSLNEKMNQIGSVLVDKDQMQKILEHVLSQIEGVANSKQPIFTEIDKLKLDIYKLGEAIRQIQEFPQRINEKIHQIGQDLIGIQHDSEASIVTLEDRLNLSYKAFLKDCEMKLLEWKKEILGTPSSNMKVKEELEQKMQMAQLDGANAIIKCKNAEQQIKLLEKKIENLQAQIKRNELKE